jgi:hypothetical protein
MGSSCAVGGSRVGGAPSPIPIRGSSPLTALPRGGPAARPKREAGCQVRDRPDA